LNDQQAAARGESQAKKVIESKLFGLVGNSFSLFDASNEYSREYIFDAEFPNTEDATKYGGQVGSTEGMTTPYNGDWQKVRTARESYEKFDAKDLRRNSFADFSLVLNGTELVEERDPQTVGNNYFVYKFRHPLNEADRGSTW